MERRCGGGRERGKEREIWGKRERERGKDRTKDMVSVERRE